MKAIGVRELKAQLSRYLREVQTGEIVLVTDRGRVIAELRSPTVTPRPESEIDRKLRLMAERGGLHIGEPNSPERYRASPLPPAPEGTAQRLLDEEREDKF